MKWTTRTHLKSPLNAAALLAPALLLLTGAAQPPKAKSPAPTPPDIVAAAPAADWIAIAPADLLVMDLARDSAGNQRRVVIQLMPLPFAQGWTDNIRKLAAAHWWDGTSINRVQDNYVVQWGDATEKKRLPATLVDVPQTDYTIPRSDQFGKSVQPSADSYAPETGFVNGWPYASDGHDAWPVHCYGMVGVGRDMPPNTGTGAELYAVIGHAPRHLDRNIAVVGRIVSGIENLSSLPRGSGPLGFYEKPDQRVMIASLRLASDLPAADRPRVQYLSTDSTSFQNYANARANRRDPFFVRPAGGSDVCNVPVPIRITP